MILFNLSQDSNPEDTIFQQVSMAERDQGLGLGTQHSDDCFSLRFFHTQYYLKQQPVIELVALIHVSFANELVRLQGTVFAATETLLEIIVDLAPELDLAQHFCTQQQLPWLDFSSPLLLEPIFIPKPWGQEIWYTGIEERGQSRVSAQGCSIPLPWILALLPQQLCAGLGREITLLKVLDPLPDEVYGDLYFEMHEQKQEVYVVTHIDKQAWPDGVGAIQFGFDPDKRRTFTSDDEFKTAYLSSVQAYETVRRAIDNLLRQKIIAQGLNANSPLAVEQLKLLTLELCANTDYKNLFATEVYLRKSMNAFTAKIPLRVGDVVRVPCFVPHALQHGVRTVEFQTPVYERKILSFAQKVLTQDHWDTAEALALITLDDVPQSALETLLLTPDVNIERVVAFDDFEVQRVYLEASKHHSLTLASYALMMVLQGNVFIDGLLSHTTYSAGQALLIPASQGKCVIGCYEKSLFLLAVPH